MLLDGLTKTIAKLQWIEHLARSKEMKGGQRTVARGRWGWREFVHLFKIGEALAYCKN